MPEKFARTNTILFGFFVCDKEEIDIIVNMF